MRETEAPKRKGFPLAMPEPGSSDCVWPLALRPQNGSASGKYVECVYVSACEREKECVRECLRDSVCVCVRVCVPLPGTVLLFPLPRMSLRGHTTRVERGTHGTELAPRLPYRQALCQPLLLPGAQLISKTEVKTSPLLMLEASPRSVPQVSEDI